ncbi:Isochorismatase hydrolase [Nemania sp. NC0429]|nr:Isochorismatase hydrolase [Nemania sp. NC0429]
MTSSDLYKPSAYPPSKTALLLLDYQNVLLDMVPGARKKAVISAAETLLDAARDNDVVILHCIVDVHNAQPAATSKASATWETQYKPAFFADPHLGAEFAVLAPPAPTPILASTPVVALAPAPVMSRRGSRAKTDRETVFRRAPGIRSALESGGIVHYLRHEVGVTHLVIGGIATSGAVLGTATHGTDVGFVVTVVADACWDPDAHVHDCLVNTVFPSLAWVASVGEAVSYMENGSSLGRADGDH